MNAEKLAKLQKLSESVRTGGKGTARRKKKVVHKAASTDDKKLQSQLKKLNVSYERFKVIYTATVLRFPQFPFTSN